MVLVGAWMMFNLSSAWAIAPESGAALFESHCAGCHPRGGNIVRRRQTLKLKSLQRDGYDTLETIADLVSQGRNNMPGFEETLTPPQIGTLAQFVLDQANHGWANR